MDPTSIAEIATIELDLALREPFGIATGAQTAARNLLVRVRLANGIEGWGEAAPFPAVNGETRELVSAAIKRVTDELVGRDVRAWRSLGAWLRGRVAESPSARCAIESAVLDALARHYRQPLWVLFGGASTRLETDLTITTGTAASARVAAAQIAREGYRTIKLKVGGTSVTEDIARVEAVISAAPTCGLLLDANGGMTGVDEALALLAAVRRVGGRVVLFEQPLGKHDLRAMAELVARADVPVGADESAGSVADVLALARAGAARVVNLKIMKSGVIEAFEMALAARAHGLGVMIGGMVESTMAMSTSASLAAGLGGFDFVDLDTPLWLLESPMEGGYVQSGPQLDLSAIDAGHGVRPRAEWLREHAAQR